MKQIGVYFLLLTCLMGLDTKACDCTGKKTVDESVKYSDVIVSGTILQKRLVKTLGGPYKNLILNPDSVAFAQSHIKGSLYAYTIVSDKVYKGNNIQDTFIVYSATSAAGCGYEFEKSKQYIIYARNLEVEDNGKKNIFLTTYCTRTNVYNDAEAKMLDKLFGK